MYQKEFISIRLDEAFKAEMQKAADLEQRSLSNLGRLLLEYAWAQYLKAGSISVLIGQRQRDLEGNETKYGN